MMVVDHHPTSTPEEEVVAKGSGHSVGGVGSDSSRSGRVCSFFLRRIFRCQNTRVEIWVLRDEVVYKMYFVASPFPRSVDVGVFDLDVWTRRNSRSGHGRVIELGRPVASGVASAGPKRNSRGLKGLAGRCGVWPKFHRWLNAEQEHVPLLSSTRAVSEGLPFFSPF
jgi:hypothetical protein